LPSVLIERVSDRCQADQADLRNAAGVGGQDPEGLPYRIVAGALPMVGRAPRNRYGGEKNSAFF
jgi:hypothetical protein